jgi:hypothetical protein
MKIPQKSIHTQKRSSVLRIIILAVELIFPFILYFGLQTENTWISLFASALIILGFAVLVLFGQR